jgi:serine/threonine protein phosphatase PrpC
MTMRVASKVIPYYDEQGYDVALVDESKGIFGIFDGMGVSEAARFASKTAAKIFKELPRDAPLVPAFLAQTMMSAIYAVGTNPNAGTTAVVASVGEDISYVHIGDSRLYVLYKGRLKQVTADEGLGNILYNYVGIRSQGVNQLGTIENWDRLLMCSDGVTGDWADQLIPDEDIERYLSTAVEPMDAIDAVIKASKKNDDKSIIVVFKD